MLRITAVGAGAVEYLVRGSGCAGHEHGRGRDQDPALAPDLGAEQRNEYEQAAQQVLREAAERASGGVAAKYFGSAVEHGEPAGKWGGSGLDMFGYTAGETVKVDDIRAIFGNLQDPESGDSLGQAPRQYKKTQERIDAATEALGPDATPEQLRMAGLAAAADGRRAVAYYDFTFSPSKSVSVYYAALLAAGETDMAAKVAAAHDRAVEVAMSYAEEHVAFTRSGYHGRTTDGRSVGKYEAGAGLIWSGWKHSTNRESEPQLHTHVAVLNRIKTISDGVIRALDGRGFRPVKEAIATAYERAVEEEITRETGAIFADRPDGKAREIVGVDVELCAEASTRRSQTLERADELVALHIERNGRAPSPEAMKKILHDAAMGTRKQKEGVQGPAAVAAWGSVAQRQERLVATVEAVADAAELAAVAGHPDARAGVRLNPEIPEQRRALLAAAVTEVQSDYATWTLGNLVAAIDRRAGVLPAEAAGQARPAYLEALAREALTPENGHEVVLLTAPDLVAVPEELCRAQDGRSIFRPHLDERYATAGQLTAEERIVASARQVSAPAILGPELEMLRVELVAAGLGPDQVAAVAGIVSSGRAGDVLIGPAGTGKSYTISALTQAWSDRVGGQVLGLATSEIAARNLADDGVPAMNTSRFLALYGAQEGGAAPRARLGRHDLVVIDEAGMSSTAELSQISKLATDAGAKLLFTGDTHQLTSVGAGGMLALLSGDNGAHELAEVHRFTNAWEKDASLRFRAGDRSVIAEYEDRGRLRGGTVEAMTGEAMRAYLGDTLAGKNSLLIVRTNDQAAQMSREIRDQLISMGRVGEAPLATLGQLGGRAEVSVGDVVQARMVDRSIRVDGAGAGAGVANRDVLTVVGQTPEGALLAKNAAGGITHLPRAYVKQHVTLGYASTVNAAQGRTVQTCHALLDEAAALEAAYVALSRGTEENRAYLASERAPDAHDAQRLETTAAGRLAGVMGNVEAEHTAVTEQRIGLREAQSLAAIGTQWDLVSQEAAAARYTEAVAEALTAARPNVATVDSAAAVDAVATEVAALTSEPGWPRLVRAVREAELAGHSCHAVLADAVAMRSLGDADSVSDVLRWRVRSVTADREPEQQVAVGDWTALAPPVDGPVGQFSHELAVLATDRQWALGQAALDAPPEWALAQLGPAPAEAPHVESGAEMAADAVGERDGSPGWWQRTVDRGRELAESARETWASNVGAVAAYRELRGISETATSIGPAPSPEQEFHRASWVQAAKALGLSLTGRAGLDPGAVDYRTLDDHELYEARERWAREQAWAPAYVAEEMRAAYELAQGYEDDVAFAGARLQQMDPADLARPEAVEELARTQRMAELAVERARQLEDIHQARAGWFAASEEARLGDELARDELSRREVPLQRETDRGEQLELFDIDDVQAPEHDQTPAIEPADIEETVEQVVERDEAVDVPDELEREQVLEIADEAPERALADEPERVEEVGADLAPSADELHVEIADDAARVDVAGPVVDTEPEAVMPAEPEVAVEPEPVDQLELFEAEPTVADAVAAEPLRSDTAESADLAAAQERAEQTIAQARVQAAAASAQLLAREAAAAARSEAARQAAEVAATERAAAEEMARQQRAELDQAAEQSAPAVEVERSAAPAVSEGPSMDPGLSIEP